MTNKLRILFFIIILINCSSKDKNKTMNNNNKENNNYTLIYDFPFVGEIRVNDLIIDKSLYKTLNGTEFINYYILNNGVQSIKVSLYHPDSVSGGTIKNETLIEASKEFTLYNTIKKNGEVTNIQQIQKLNFAQITTPVPYLISEWKFNSHLPFELEGWKKSEDLSKWDEKKLEEAVVRKYNELRNILNSGNGDEFLKQLEFANKEFFISNYYTEDEKSEYLSVLKEDFSVQKNLVPKIENYQIKIMGDGKVVALESVGKNTGQGILTTEDGSNNKLYVIYIMLHKPQNSNDFQIVRYFSYKTRLLEK